MIVPVQRDKICFSALLLHFFYLWVRGFFVIWAKFRLPVLRVLVFVQRIADAKIQIHQEMDNIPENKEEKT